MSSNTGKYADLTLAEALKQFRAEEGLEERYRGISEKARIQFDRHDIMHVLFGLSTSMEHEVRADGWALFGSDVSWADVRAFYSLPEYNELMDELGAWNVTKAFFANLPALYRIWRRSRSMSKNWPWSDHARFEGWTVGQIRQEFGIQRSWLAS